MVPRPRSAPETFEQRWPAARGTGRQARRSPSCAAGTRFRIVQCCRQRRRRLTGSVAAVSPGSPSEVRAARRRSSSGAILSAQALPYRRPFRRDSAEASFDELQSFATLASVSDGDLDGGRAPDAPDENTRRTCVPLPFAQWSSGRDWIDALLQDAAVTRRELPTTPRAGSGCPLGPSRRC